MVRTEKDTAEQQRLIDLLLNMSVGSKLAIDPRTHQRGMKRVILVNYIYYAARLIQDRPSAEITSEVLEHLEDIQQQLETVWGKLNSNVSAFLVPLCKILIRPSRPHCRSKWTAKLSQN
jgi:hypothetical protein